MELAFESCHVLDICFNAALSGHFCFLFELEAFIKFICGHQRLLDENAMVQQMVADSLLLLDSLGLG